MPLWTVYHPVDIWSEEDRTELAGKITDIYAQIMPRFYVGVVFQPIPADSFYVGGAKADKFVRFVVEHIARAFPDRDRSRRFIDKVNEVIAPFVKDRGLDWELHIDETPFDYWSINGHYPPRGGTEDEKSWRSENRPLPRTHD
jgi:phenylpyruvate tautomerase PptA (4-oxalocrotonate tautomerase family)